MDSPAGVSEAPSHAAAGGGVQPPTDTARVAHLDGLRGCAILMIVALHFLVHPGQYAIATAGAYLQKYFLCLSMGVDLFFVLSGFLIGGILLDRRDATNYFSVFYLRRSARIFPAYFLLLAVWLLTGIVASRPAMNWLLEPAVAGWPYAAYVQNFAMAWHNHWGPHFVAPTWSLAIEEQFYLLLPLVVRFTPRRVLAALLISAVTLAPLFRLAATMAGEGTQTARSVLLPMRWDALLLGTLIALLLRVPHLVDRWRGRRRFALWIFAGAALLVILLPVIRSKTGGLDRPLHASTTPLLLAVFFALLIAVLHFRWLPGLNRLLAQRTLRYFGRLSYCMYLFHVPVLGVVFALAAGRSPSLQSAADILLVGLAFALTIGVAEATWRLFEARLITFGHRFAYRAASPAGP